MDIAGYAPLIALGGILVGSSVTYLLTNRTEVNKNLMLSKKDAYVDFVNSVGMIAVFQRSDDKNGLAESNILLANAKSRISIYGSNDVVSALAAFFRSHDALDSAEAQLSFIRIILAMRRDAGGVKDRLSYDDVAQVIFGTDIEKQ